MSVSVDTSALLALLDAEDPEHERAKTTWDALAEEGTSLVSTNYLVVEAMSVAQYRLGMDAVRALADDILPVIDVRFIDASTSGSEGLRCGLEPIASLPWSKSSRRVAP